MRGTRLNTPRSPPAPRSAAVTGWQVGAGRGAEQAHCRPLQVPSCASHSEPPLSPFRHLTAPRAMQSVKRSVLQTGLRSRRARGCGEFLPWLAAPTAGRALATPGRRTSSGWRRAALTQRPTYLRVPTARLRTAAAAAAAAAGPRARASGALWPPPSSGVGGPPWAAAPGHIPAASRGLARAPSSRGLPRRRDPRLGLRASLPAARGGGAAAAPHPRPAPARLPARFQAPGTQLRRPERGSGAAAREGTGAGRPSLRWRRVRGAHGREILVLGLTVTPLNVHCRGSVPEDRDGMFVSLPCIHCIDFVQSPPPATR